MPVEPAAVSTLPSPLVLLHNLHVQARELYDRPVAANGMARSNEPFHDSGLEGIQSDVVLLAGLLEIAVHARLGGALARVASRLVWLPTCFQATPRVRRDVVFLRQYPQDALANLPEHSR